MSLKDDIIKAVGRKVEKQNPWQPYTGPAGGQGWVNAITGEVRYQESRPAPDEGVPDDYDGEIPEPDEEVPDTLDPYEPTAEDYLEHLEPGMEISGEVAGTPYEGEIVDFYEDDQGVRVETADGEEAVMYWDEVHHPSAIEPPDGWAENWQSAPNTTDELDVGEYAEVYDLESGEYVHGEIQDVAFTDDPDFEDGYVSVRTDDGDLIEITPGDIGGDDAVLTAIEDETLDLEELEDIADVEVGDTYHLSVDEDFENYENFINAFGDDAVEVEVTDVNDHAASVINVATGEEASFNDIHIDDEGIDILESDGEIEMLDPGEVTGIDPEMPDESDWGLLNGQEAVVETLEGEAEGSVDFIREDPEGHLWFSVGGDETMEIGGYDLSLGDEITIEESTSHPHSDPITYTGEFIGEYEGPATGDYAIEIEDADGDPMEYTFDAEAIVDTPESEEGVTVTTNPQSPFYAGDAVQGVEDPFTAPSAADEYKIGDQVVIGDEIEEVDGSDIEAGKVMLTDGEWYTHDELADVADEVATQESVDPPDDSPQDEWESPVKINDDGSISMQPFGTGTYVYHHDEDSGQMEISQVSTFSDGAEIDLDNGETIHRANVEGYAHDTKQNVVEPGMLNIGESIMVSEDGTEITGTVYDTNTHGSTSVELVDEDGNFHSVKPGHPGTAITEHNPDGGAYEPEAFEIDEDGNIVDERETTAIVEDLSERIDFGDRDSEGRLEKGGPELAKQQKRALQEGLYRQFGVEPVEDFYDMKSAWKGNSGSSPKAETLERAYKQAFGINAPNRDNGGAPPDERVIKMAEAIGELSRDYFEDVFGESHELARGSSGVAWGSFVDQFLSDPTQDEYSLSFLANNNHTTDFRGTADKWNAFTAQREVVPDDVLTMTDHLFETSYESELEIGIKGDDQTIPIEGIHPGPQSRDGRPVGLSSNIETWDSEITENFWQSMSQASDEVGYDSFGTGQLENLKRLVDHTDSIGANPSNAAVSELEKARGILVENGMPPEADDPTERLEFEDFEGLGDVTDYEMGQGIPATAVDPIGEGTIEGEIMGTYDGMIMMWEEDEYGDPAETEVEPDELVDVDEDALEDAQQQASLPSGDGMMDTYSPSMDDFDQLDEVYYTHGSDLKEGKVLDVDGDTVEISGDHGQTEYFDRDDVEGGMVVPQSQVESAGGGGFDWQGVGSADEIEAGEWIQINPGVHGEEQIVQVDHIDDGDVYPDSNSVDDFDPDPYYYPDEIEAVSPDPSGGDGGGNAPDDLGSPIGFDALSSYEDGDRLYVDAPSDEYPKEVEFFDYVDNSESGAMPDKALLVDQEDGGTIQVDGDDPAYDIFDPGSSEGGGSADPAYNNNNPFEEIGLENGTELDVSNVSHPQATDTGTVTSGEYSSAGDPLLTVEDNETGHPLTLTTDADGNWVYPGGGTFEETPDPSDFDDGPVPAENLHDVQPGVGEFVDIESNVGETMEVEVVDTPMDPGGPIEVEDEFGDPMLVWPDGDLETV